MFMARITVTKMISKRHRGRHRVAKCGKAFQEARAGTIKIRAPGPALQEDDFVRNIPLNGEFAMRHRIEDFFEFLKKPGFICLLYVLLRRGLDKSSGDRERGRQRDLESSPRCDQAVVLERGEL